MARRFVRSSSRTNSQRRSTLWLAITPGLDVADSAGRLAFNFNAAALGLRPFTIVRTHIEIMLTSDQSIAAESYGAAFGMSIVSEQAIAVGVTAVPLPIDDLGSDFFFVHQSMWGDFQFKSAVGFDAQGGSRYTIDSKAMRKVDEDQDLAATVQGAGASLGENSLVSSMGRMLVKLH